MSHLRQAEEELGRALRRLEPRTPYAEVMAERTGGYRLTLDTKAVNPSASPALEGAVFRAWDGHAWVESATTGLSARSLDAAVAELTRRLPASLPSQGPPGASPTGRAEATTPVHRPIEDFPLEAQIEWARRLLGWATSVDGIQNAFVNLLVDVDERLFLSTSGAMRHQTQTFTLGNVTPLAIEGGKVEFDLMQVGRSAGLEVVDAFTEDKVVATAREAFKLLKAKPAPTGMHTVVLDQSTTGTFAHESFGHGTEADQILRDRSYLKPLIGEQVGPECLTLVDNGALPGEWGTIFFDDEGHPSQRNVLVDHGRFVEVLHDRESAEVLHRKPTGNTRRADFLSRAFVRMTNTYVEGGDHTLDDLLAEAKDGVLLEHFTSGIEDPLGGNMQLKVKRGRRIEHGELTDVYSSMALSGKVLEFLKEIRGVSKARDLEISPGFCGKGFTDSLNTGAGGPYLLSRAVVGPA
jgi:TldD protein